MAARAKAPPTKHWRTTLERVEKFVSADCFTDCNLRGQLYGGSVQVDDIRHVDFAFRRGVTFVEAAAALASRGTAVSTGFTFGPTWSTHWFRLQFAVAPSLGAHVRLRWDSGCEALLWSADGAPLLGLAAERGKTDFPIAAGADEHVFYVECAANGLFGAGGGDCIAPPDPSLRFTVCRAEVVAFRPHVAALLADLDVLLDLARELPETDQRRHRALYTANAIVNACDPADLATVEAARSLAVPLIEPGGQPVTAPFSLVAVGNCHIDTAWLWPYAETRRKCARSWSTTLRLMQRYDQLTFAVSQAQQLVWLRDDYPTLFAEIQERVSEGRFAPVGGCWVEMDGNLPSGESFVRQMFYGQRAFHEMFGRYCTEFWLPDTFGYSAQLPQLMRRAGMSRFVSQKLSWNLVNKFPHNTFYWAGISGDRVLCHFPPGDSYCLEARVADCLKSANNFRDAGRSASALMLFGFGDGGGGPSEEMCERLTRLRRLDGCPPVRSATPADYFAEVERDEMDNLCTWRGELYLELHNGTYTTHAEMKRLNRQCEWALRDCELLAAFEWLLSKGVARRDYSPQWKTVLLNQFHDVLPGTSIEQAMNQAKQLDRDVLVECRRRSGCAEFDSALIGSDSDDCWLLNSLPWRRTLLTNGAFYELAPLSVSRLSDLSEADRGADSVRARTMADGSVELANKYLTAVLDRCGRVSQLWLNDLDGGGARRNAVAAGAFCNQLALFDDVPLYWDAWDVMDYHVETRRPLVETVSPAALVESSAARAVVAVRLRVGAGSQATQRISLTAGEPLLVVDNEVDWRERHKLLKAEFAVDVLAADAVYEMQFGHVRRPTHANTSWDTARFEVCGHKWADLSEFGFGVAVLNDGKYGWSCRDNVLSLSLLRAPQSPCPKTDEGLHRFRFAIQPHFGPFQAPAGQPLNVIQQAYNFNCPVKSVNNWQYGAIESAFQLSDPGVIMETVKLADDDTGVILRCYESFGRKTVASIAPSKTLVNVKAAWLCDLLERKEDQLEVNDNRLLDITFGPFQVISIFLAVKF